MLRRQLYSDDTRGWTLVAVAIALAALFLALFPWHPAVAQEVVPIAETVTVVPPWWMAYVQPVIDTVIGLAVAAAGAAAIQAYRWLAAKAGIDLDEKHESALRNTVQSAAKALLMDLIAQAAGGKLRLDARALTGAADYVARAVPDAIDHFGKTRGDIMEMVKGAVPDAMKAAGVAADLEQPGVIAASTSILLDEAGMTIGTPPKPVSSAPGGAGGAS